MKLNQTVCQVIDDVFMQYHIVDTSKPVMITFPPGCQAITQHQAEANDTNAWSFQFFAKRGINVVSFNHIGQDNYFHSEEFARFLPLLSTQLDVFPKRIGYGISRGGFASAIHSKVLGLDKALLLMPLSSYNHKTVPWDPKVKANHVPDQALNLDASVCETPLTVIYDPLYAPDTQHVARLDSVVAEYHISGVGHRISRALQQMGMLKKVVLDFYAADIESDAFYQGIRQRRLFPSYLKGTLANSRRKVTLKRRWVITQYRCYLIINNSHFCHQKFLSKLAVSCQKRWNKVLNLYQQVNLQGASKAALVLGNTVFCL
ncbi:alpha/beta hydrolase family protein [Shewanella gaetbuli]|uniref:Alpha/beta hydrolase family protein n=1 Tax=Shewanella gaetbuli TaxID=220752 RepID=A0A9X1ZS05_9GAMM|nr:hypothetical protein [Shewanella gaetbuli]MCL1144340.1 hypothetical protein [Shewanella gaetbuli]